MLAKLANLEKLINYRKPDFRRDSNLQFYISDYKSLKELFKAIYFYNLSIEDAERIPKELMAILNGLEGHTSNNLNAKNLYDGRQMIIESFKNKLLPFKKEEFDDFDDDDFDKRPDDDETHNKFYTPRELEIIPELSNFENEEEISDIRELESEESA